MSEGVPVWGVTVRGDPWGEMSLVRGASTGEGRLTQLWSGDMGGWESVTPEAVRLKKVSACEAENCGRDV